MPVSVSIAVIIVCIAVVGLIAYLVVLAARLRALADDLRCLVRDQVAPLLSESRAVVSRFNNASRRVTETLDSVSRTAGRLEGGLAKVNPTHLGQRLALYAARAMTIWLAGLSRAAAALREKKKEGNEQSSEEV